jgi:hypothetical protein
MLRRVQLVAVEINVGITCVQSPLILDLKGKALKSKKYNVSKKHLVSLASG